MTIGHSNIDKTNIIMTNDSLMKVESTADWKWWSRTDRQTYWWTDIKKYKIISHHYRVCGIYWHQELRNKTKCSYNKDHASHATKLWPNTHSPRTIILVAPTKPIAVEKSVLNVEQLKYKARASSFPVTLTPYVIMLCIYFTTFEEALTYSNNFAKMGHKVDPDWRHKTVW